MSRQLALAWKEAGHVVRVVTASPGDDALDGIEVIRAPGPAELWSLTRWCDLCVHNNISLGWAWSPVLARKPWFVIHQTWLRSSCGRVGWREQLKRITLRWAHSIAISRAVATALPVSATVIPNGYDDHIFHPSRGAERRKRDLVFVGRLVSDKGVDLLIDALSCLASSGVRPGLTIVGDGPERDRLQHQARQAGVAAQVRWTGFLQGQSLASELRQHRVMVVPSRWAEPFGIVALEGAACGCFVVGSRDGGLADAIGPCGLVFKNGDVAALREALIQALAENPAADQAAIRDHLDRHRSVAVADQYLRLFGAALLD